MALSGVYSDFSGIRINGVPVDPSPYNWGGNVYNPLRRTIYVCSLGASGAGTLFGDGSRPDLPLATLQAAITSIAGRTTYGDVIKVLPGHAENISTADYFSGGGTAANFRVEGVGFGPNRPTFTFTLAAATWLLDTAGVVIDNCIFNLAGPAGTTAITVATPFVVSGNGCAITNCSMPWGIDADQIVGTGITVTGDDFLFAGNVAIGAVAAAPTSTFLTANAADRIQLLGNYISGCTAATTTGVVHFLTTASLDIRAYGNFFENLLASSTKAFSSAIAGVTGEVSYNRASVNSGIVAYTASSNLSCRFNQNFTSDTVNQNGALDVAGGTST